MFANVEAVLLLTLVTGFGYSIPTANEVKNVSVDTGKNVVTNSENAIGIQQNQLSDIQPGKTLLDNSIKEPSKTPSMVSVGTQTDDVLSNMGSVDKLTNIQPSETKPDTNNPSKESIHYSDSNKISVGTQTDDAAPEGTIDKSLEEPQKKNVSETTRYMELPPLPPINSVTVIADNIFPDKFNLTSPVEYKYTKTGDKNVNSSDKLFDLLAENLAPTDRFNMSNQQTSSKATDNLFSQMNDILRSSTSDSFNQLDNNPHSVFSNAVIDDIVTDFITDNVQNMLNPDNMFAQIDNISSPEKNNEDGSIEISLKTEVTDTYMCPKCSISTDDDIVDNLIFSPEKRDNNESNGLLEKLFSNKNVLDPSGWLSANEQYNNMFPQSNTMDNNENNELLDKLFSNKNVLDPSTWLNANKQRNNMFSQPHTIDNEINDAIGNLLTEVNNVIIPGSTDIDVSIDVSYDTTISEISSVPEEPLVLPFGDKTEYETTVLPTNGFFPQMDDFLDPNSEIDSVNKKPLIKSEDNALSQFQNILQKIVNSANPEDEVQVNFVPLEAENSNKITSRLIELLSDGVKKPVLDDDTTEFQKVLQERNDSANLGNNIRVDFVPMDIENGNRLINLLSNNNYPVRGLPSQIDESNSQSPQTVDSERNKPLEDMLTMIKHDDFSNKVYHLGESNNRPSGTLYLMPLDDSDEYDDLVKIIDNQLNRKDNNGQSVNFNENSDSAINNIYSKIQDYISEKGSNSENSNNGNVMIQKDVSVRDDSSQGSVSTSASSDHENSSDLTGWYNPIQFLGGNEGNSKSDKTTDQFTHQIAYH